MRAAAPLQVDVDVPLVREKTDDARRISNPARNHVLCAVMAPSSDDVRVPSASRSSGALRTPIPTPERAARSSRVRPGFGQLT
jgi:hypothetical protein